MSYLTRYSVTAAPEIIAEIRRFNPDQAGVAFNEAGIFEERVTWYEYLEDLERVATMYPGAAGTVSAQGEDPADRWEITFSNGNLFQRRAEFVFGEWKAAPPGKGPR